MLTPFFSHSGNQIYYVHCFPEFQVCEIISADIEGILYFLRLANAYIQCKLHFISPCILWDLN